MQAFMALVKLSAARSIAFDPSRAVIFDAIIRSRSTGQSRRRRKRDHHCLVATTDGMGHGDNVNKKMMRSTRFPGTQLSDQYGGPGQPCGTLRVLKVIGDIPKKII